MVGKIGTNIIVVSAVCRSWTWHLSAFVSGWGHLISFSTLPPWVWVISFDLSVTLCHVIMTSDFSMSNTAKSIVVPSICSREVGLCKYQPSSVSHTILIHNKKLCSSVSCRWCGNHYGPPSIKVTSCRLQLIIQEVGLETPDGTLEPACLNGRFVAFDVRFLSLASDRMILRVFDISSFIHTPWIVPVVPWGPLSLLVVSLASVNSFHYWLVIRRCSCMFDFRSQIHMLELVLCLGRDGAQDPGLCLL